MNWNTLVEETLILATRCGQQYVDKVKFEIKEIDKQGGNDYWLELISSKRQFEHNKNGLVLPFLHGLTKIDPVIGTNELLVDSGNNDLSLKEVDGVEIVTSDGDIINVSLFTLVKTNRGYIKAIDLIITDELIS